VREPANHEVHISTEHAIEKVQECLDSIEACLKANDELREAMRGIDWTATKLEG
jgi:hypothetical protein